MPASKSLEPPTPRLGVSSTTRLDLQHSTNLDLSIHNAMEFGLTGGPTVLKIEKAENMQASHLSLDGARGLGSVFSYATSKWALCCIAMAVILNRTHIFAATRRRLRLTWQIRVVLRVLPVVLLFSQAWHLLQSIHCQTSPNFVHLRWGNSTKTSHMLLSHSNDFLNKLASSLLFGSTDKDSCDALHMIPSGDPGRHRELRGSLSSLWPLFGTFCLSHFLESVSCAVQGRAVATETGMTLFEQSLAFAEADAAINNQLGWANLTQSHGTDPKTANEGSGVALTRSMILRRVNIPPEVLFVAFLSSMTHITSHILGILDLQSKYRLFNTGFWGLCFMGSIVWSAIAFEIDNPVAQGLLRFPTVCIIGFIPHVIVLTGICLSLLIYSLAMLLSILAPPPSLESTSINWYQRLTLAHANMQANLSLSEIPVTREMDFYTALLRTGFVAITMASEAVYLTEDNAVNVKHSTWLEEARFREVENLQRDWMDIGSYDSRYDKSGAIGLIPVKGSSNFASKGYSRERAAQKVTKRHGDRGQRIGIGAAERSSRWLMALVFILKVGKLLTRVVALIALWILGTARIRSQPVWLLWLARRSKLAKEENDSATGQASARIGNHPPVPSTSNDARDEKDGLDVEAEFRRLDRSRDEDSLDKDLYQYWLDGGWWGSKDASGDYEPGKLDDDWDNTSIISTVAGSEVEDDHVGWESDDDCGQRTPTQCSPHTEHEGGSVFDSPLSMHDLARLLHPRNSNERKEAEALAAHLQSDEIITRARYQRTERLQRTRILTASGPSTLRFSGSSQCSRNIKLTADEEERLLEQLLWSRRQGSARDTDQLTEAAPASLPVVAESPLCVVCQCSTRTIIVWPCRCLSLCDDCRVSLAMNNFDKCVCCRRDVLSFSRIYVP